MHDHLNRAEQLGMHSRRRKPCQRTQGLEPGHDVSARVGVQSAASALVPGVERSQHLAHLGTSNFTNDEAVGTHAQRLTHE
jgi:hypothetical protein